MNGQQRVIIEQIKPQINCGEFPIKRVINEKVIVEATIFCDGHDVLSAEVLYKYDNEKQWSTSVMEYVVNDRWRGGFIVSQSGTYQYTVNAWIDHFKTWHTDILKKIEVQADYSIDLLIGAELIQQSLDTYKDITVKDETFLKEIIAEFQLKDGITENKIKAIRSNDLFNTMKNYPVKQLITRVEKELEVMVERQRANFSTWYEVFPRSLNPDGVSHGTFKDCANFLPYIAEMGFDVLYLPPVHPIGVTKRKGKNNSVTAEKGDPGSPWAIGGKEGGHKSINPSLGTMDDFKELIRKASESGIEIALDMAFQCSPDHPYIKEHPEWFKIRPDGTLQYAENPPKKYEDIYPLNFETDDWNNLWEELKSIFLFWIEQGIKIFRVDNPHTKSFRFWEWVIRELKNKEPDLIFLAEAFTRPSLMYNLAKRGFTQSYTYFTWRNTKYDLTAYCKELVSTEAKEFFRPNFWPNTPDILPEFLQFTNRAGYIQRIILAATLSSNYGIYGPAFELMENVPTSPGKEEYLNSEKYEIKNWDINNPGNLNKIIKRVNKIRKENTALQNTHSLKFHEIDNEALVCFSKTSDDLSNIILVVVSLDEHYTHSGWLKFPIEEFEMDKNVPFQVHDLLSDAYFLWNGERNYIEVNPGIMPAHIFKVRRKIRSEKDFDYFL